MSDQEIKLNPAPTGKYGTYTAFEMAKEVVRRDLRGLGDAVKRFQQEQVSGHSSIDSTGPDEMCRCNNQWHYYAKPILRK